MTPTTVVAATCHSTCAAIYDRFTFETGCSEIGGCGASQHRRDCQWTISPTTRARLS
jgi:hypothetical protein